MSRGSFSITGSSQWRAPRWVFYLGSVIILIIVISYLLPFISAFYLESSWFANLGLGQRFWSEWKWRALLWGIGAITAIVTVGVFLWSIYRRFDEMVKSLDEPQWSSEGFSLTTDEMSLELKSIRAILNFARWAAPALAAIVLGNMLSREWPTILQWWYGQATGESDQVLGRDISYYLFSYPAYNVFLHFAGALLVITGIVLALLAVWLWSFRARTDGFLSRRFSLAVTRLGALWAVGAFIAVGVHHLLERPALLLETHNIFSGLNYVGGRFWLGAEKFLAIVAFVVAGLAASLFLFPLVRQLKKVATALGIVYAVALVGSFLIANAIWWTNVRPNEFESERPYITLNIAATRKAYGLDQFKEVEFKPAGENVGAIAASRADFDNVRLWDWRALKASLTQIQSIRTYYSFPDIDVDRYRIGGRRRQVMLAVRELDINQLPEKSQSWNNRHFIYTHGYGVTMNLVNAFTAEGAPALLLKDMPVASLSKDLQVARPQIYFGEMTQDHVYVGTTQREFDYPVGEENAYNVYDGPSGVSLGSYFAKLATSIYLGDGFQLLLSDYLMPNSRVLFRRNVRDRVQAVAPFLILDQDPYAVVTADGRIVYMIDAYTTSRTYPLSTRSTLNEVNINYVRNSVKAVVDAYTGEVTLYVFDEKDPIISSYRRAWPAAFRARSEMPPDLMEHIRYPVDMLVAQAQVYALYHMQDEQIFYNREDLWERAHQVRSVQAGDQQTVGVGPYTVELRLHKDRPAEFVQILPFTPTKKTNLIGWMAASCDRENYGEVIIYHFPKNYLTPGPLQIEARIDQDPQLSPMLTLWNQQGSQVLRGDLLPIPIANQMLYIEPIYLQAARNPMPELRLVVIALENRLVFGRNFDEAYAKLVGEQAIEAAPAPAPAEGEQPGASPAVADIDALIRSAASHLRAYEKASAEGRHADAGRELDALKADLERLSSLSKR